MSFSAMYFALIGLLIVAAYYRRIRLYVRFVRYVKKIQGPPWWDLLTVHAKKFLSDDHLNYNCKMCAEFMYKPWGFWSTTLEYVLVVSDPESTGEIVKNKNMADKADMLYGPFASYLNGSLVLNGDRWKWHRKTINPAFRKTNMDARIDIICEGAENIVECFRKFANDRDVDISEIIDEETTKYSLNFITNNLQITPSARRLYKALDIGMPLVQQQTLNPIKHWYRLKFDKAAQEADYVARSTIADSMSWFNEAKIVAKKRMIERNDDQPTDIVECLSRGIIDGVNVTDQEILEEALTLAAGSSETTRVTTKTAMMVLSLNPDIQQRAYEEVIEILGSDLHRRPTPEDLPKMKYLDAVIREVLRLYPSVPLIARKVNRKSNINGAVMPGGSNVLINIHALHRNPQSFEDPLKFKPERFLTDSDKRHPYAYIPFGCGQRVCVGYPQAMMMLKIVLSTILRNYKLLPGKGLNSMDEVKFKMAVTVQICDPVLKLVDRKTRSIYRDALDDFRAMENVQYYKGL